MMMRKIVYIPLVWLASWLLLACESDEKVYQGPQFVQFADSVCVFPVANSVHQEYEIFVVTSQPVAEDQFFGIEVNEKLSSAKRGEHYQMISNYIRIGKGSNVGSFKIKGFFDSVGQEDSLWIQFQLVSNDLPLSPLYGKSARVQLVKDCGFDVEAFTGNMSLMATFPFTSGDWIQLPVISERVDENSVLIKDMFFETYDVKLFFDPSDPLKPKVHVPDQVAFVDGRYGKVYCSSLPDNPSYFDSCRQRIVLNLMMYVPRIGSFGVFTYYLDVDPTVRQRVQLPFQIHAITPN